MSAMEIALDAPEIGLRELKKQMTHQAIAQAAFELTLEKGLDHLTVEEISRAAIVSPRTFSNYFSSKEEAVVAAGTDDPHAYVPAFKQAMQDAPPLRALCQVLSEYYAERTEDQLMHMRQLAALVDENPSLLASQAAHFVRIEEELRLAVAERSGTHVDSDMYPWLVAASAVAGIRSALRLWAPSGGGADVLVSLVQEAFNQISAGLPVPHR